MDKAYTEKHQYKPGIILQILTLVTLGLLIIGVITYFSQYRIADADTKEVAEEFASRVADEVKESVQEYPAYPWLLRYWYEHSEDMDIEYDVDYQTGTRTEEKQRLLSSRHPDFLIRYVDESDVLALPEEDQKLYAESPTPGLLPVLTRSRGVTISVICTVFSQMMTAGKIPTELSSSSSVPPFPALYGAENITKSILWVRSSISVTIQSFRNPCAL